ncbi:hypothetical protein OH492_23905 [Vibrio chagasii]|nr:hypothetical protein [Vibrio chagasii]
MIICGVCAHWFREYSNVSDNIEIIRVDRFLEHPRVMIFHNAGKLKVYISSADWMIPETLTIELK